MARPTKYTEARRKVILDSLRAGLTRTAAAAKAEIPLQRLEVWLNRFVGFREDVMRAEGEAESRFTAVIAKAANPHEVIEIVETVTPEGTTIRTTTRHEFDWRAAESWLKRRRRADWGDSLDVRKLDDDTLLRLVVAAAGGGATELTGPPAAESAATDATDKAP